MGRTNQQQKAARAGRRKARSGRRRRGGVKAITLGSKDGAVVLRGNGQLQFHESRETPSPGTSAFWLHMLRWLFAGTEEGAERRQILIDDFMLDLQEHAVEQRRLSIEAEAAKRATAEIDAMEGEVTEENREDLTAELLPKHIAEVEAEVEPEPIPPTPLTEEEKAELAAEDQEEDNERDIEESATDVRGEPSDG